MGGAAMKWPLVSRELYDRERSAVVSWLAMYNEANDARRDWAKRYDALLEKYHALKLAGASIPEPPVQRERKSMDELDRRLIQASAGKSRPVQAAMHKQLAEDRKAIELGLLTEGDVMRRIEQGFTPDDGIPE